MKGGNQHKLPLCSDFMSCFIQYVLYYDFFYFLNFSSRLSGDTCSGDTCSQILPIEEEDWTNWVSRKLMLLHVEG